MNHTASGPSRAVKRFALIAAALVACSLAVVSTASASNPAGLQGCLNVGNLNTAPTPTNWTDGRHSPKEQAAYIIAATAGIPVGYYGGTVLWKLVASAYNPSTGSLNTVPLSEDCVDTYAHRRSDGVIYKTQIRTRLRVTSSAGDVAYGDTRWRRVCAYPASTPVDGNGIPIGSNCLLLTNYNIG